MNHCSGTTMRRSSQMRTTTYVLPISSIRPHSFSTITTSSRRIGCASAICRPAMRLPNTGRAAMPAITPTMPAEASSVAPTWRIAGNVINTRAPPTSMTTTCSDRPSTRACVWMRRASRLSSPFVGWRSRMPRSTPPIARTSSQTRHSRPPTPSPCRIRPSHSGGSGVTATARLKNSSGSATAVGIAMTCTTRASVLRASCRWVRRASASIRRYTSAPSNTATSSGHPRCNHSGAELMQGSCRRKGAMLGARV